MENINANIHVINDEKFIYKIESVRQIDSSEYALSYTLELVAGWDYINPDNNDVQGFVSAKNFIDAVQIDFMSVYPLSESLGERLKEEGYKVIDISNYNIKEVK
ncbi:hypothetical protein P4639_22030 [Priestia megaterium]|uniref:hypothetical protein n=1 Tax=Priestia megaterium TaxID=1404 RepID=UPI002E1DE1C9|nr:hypothetical protein [Priestia megaterium]